MKLINSSFILFLIMTSIAHCWSQEITGNTDKTKELKEPQCSEQMAVIIGQLYYYSSPNEVLND